MSIWRRVKNLVLAKMRNLRDSKDPREVLKKDLSRMKGYLEQMEEKREKLSQQKANMEKWIKRLEETITNYQQEAQSAVEIGEEGQAKLALQEKHRAVETKRGVEECVKQLEEEIRSLEGSERALENRIKIFRTKGAELDALRDASKAELRVREITSGISEEVSSSIQETIRESEQRLREIQAKLAATEEIETMERGELDLEGPGIAPEENGRDLEEELQRLKSSSEEGGSNASSSN